jgi:hypothetical protein
VRIITSLLGIVLLSGPLYPAMADTLAQPVPALASRAAGQSENALLGARAQVVLPFQITQGYVFLEGQALGHSGVFLFDTGSPFSLFLNNQLLPLTLSHFSGVGSAGSGQVLKLYRHDGVGPIRLADRVLTGLGPLNSTDLGFLTDMHGGGVRPDVLGFAGLALVRDLEFTLDYAKSTLELHRTSADGDALIAHVNPADVVATLAFRFEGNHMPVVTLQLGAVEMKGWLDTGTPGKLVLTAPTRATLEEAGILRCAQPICALSALRYQDTALDADVPAVVTGEENQLQLGYNLLRHYRSVWNYRKQTITLLRPGSP